MKIQTKLENLQNYKVYLQVEAATHDFFQKKKFLKTDLPVLSPALIPESYLEIFETEFNYFNNKQKLYLTPSPELFLKRLLVAGIGNCYYLGRSFRNSEPSSSWHLPEFTMLEFYKLNVNYLELSDEVLDLLRFIAEKLKFKKIKFNEWEKYSVAQAFHKFAGINEQELFDEKLFIKKARNKGYKTDKASYEDLFSQIMATEIEPKLGVNRQAALLYDYPKQMASLAKLSTDGKTAERCEFYINGLEIGGFCTELNDYREQEKRFIKEADLRKKNHLIDHQVDKGFIEALKYGLPRCTGAGIGFERLVMVFAGTDSVDELKLINIK